LGYNNCLPAPLIRPAKRGTFSQREKEKPPLWEMVEVRECGIMSNYFELAII